MKIILSILLFVTFVTADEEVNDADEWKQTKSPLDSPRYQAILSDLFPELIPTGKISRGGRIAGGEVAKLGQFKHQALLMTKDSLGDDYVCGGAIISHNWILTASHCLDDIIKVTVYVGIINRVNGPAVWALDVTDQDNMIMHESYVPSNLANDIALIRLLTTIKNDQNVGIIQLPSRLDASVTLDGMLAKVAGFGRTSDTVGPSQVLKWVQTSIAPNDACVKVFGKANVRDSNLCLSTAGGKSSCQGDSGGGLTVELEGVNVLVGIVSYGAAVSCTQNHPAVFTRVTSYLEWIESKTRITIN